MQEADYEIVSEGTATHEAAADDTTPTPEALPPAQPSALARNMPINADTLMAWASRLESESERYTTYSPPHTALSQAANSLRSAVGHVLTGRYTKGQA